MKTLSLLRGFLIGIVLISVSLDAKEQGLLKAYDVDRVMNQIFDQHVEQKTMTDEILRNSFKVYIDQFDPDRIYLLESEVDPFLNLSNNDLRRIMAQYKRHNFLTYDKLNDVIQKSIIRARQYRKQLKGNRHYLFTGVTSGMQQNGSEEDLLPFAKNIEKLRDRQKKHIQFFISGEKRRYGDALISRNENKTLAILEKHMRGHEDEYLFHDEKDRILPKAERENLLTMHILKALSNSLDAHTSFLDPSEAYDMRVRLEKGYKGVGIVLEKTPNGVNVKRLIDGGPAKKSGLIHVNDQILSINGTAVSAMSVEAVVKLIRDSDRKTMLFSLKRKLGNTERVLKVKLRAEKIVVDEGRVKSSFEKFGNGIIGKIKLNSFYQGDSDVTSEKDVAKAIRELDKSGNLRGIILDLRDNSGGFLTQAVKVAGLFITNGVIVVSKYHNGDEVYYRDMDSNVSWGGPLVILTSKATASAAEIVAQALQDYGVAVVVGDEQTYGKGTIQSQTITNNKSSSFFKVTVGKYYTVSGKTPQVNGVKSDVLVPSKYAYLDIGEEHLDYVLSEDRIESSYIDKLADIDPNLRPWYLRYYMPTIQHRTYQWKNMIPVLKQNSEYRISKNKDYQMFLDRLKDDQDLSSLRGNFGRGDLQMAEAINIVKDMVLIDSRQHVEGVGELFDHEEVVLQETN